MARPPLPSGPPRGAKEKSGRISSRGAAAVQPPGAVSDGRGAVAAGAAAEVCRGGGRVGDLVRCAGRLGTGAGEGPMAVARVVAARARLAERPSWTVVFARAFALVAAEVPELRRAYLGFPRPHLYEHPDSVA